MRLIDADTIPWEGFPNDFGEYYEDYVEKRAVDKMPTIEARPVVMGQWLVSQDEYFELYTIRCSVCHGEWCFEAEGDIVAMCYNYCPKCGNPMLVVKKEVQDEAVSEA